MCDSLNNKAKLVLVPPAGYGYVAVLVDVAGALAAQLQGDRCEVFGRCFHDHFSHRAISSVENVIEPLSQQLLGLWYPTIYHWVELLTYRGDKITQSIRGLQIISSVTGKFHQKQKAERRFLFCFFN